MMYHSPAASHFSRLAARYGISGSTGPLPVTGLDFDEHDLVSIPHDQVDLTGTAVPIASNEDVAQSFQEILRELFSLATELS